MKTNNIIVCLLLLALTTAFVACEDEINQWPIEMGDNNRLFSSLEFDMEKVEATSIAIKYSQSPEATHYIFEFSEDSLAFTTIVRADSILADTLTQANEATSPMKKEYKTLFENLKGVTSYSVRMKSFDELTGRESVFQSFYFETPQEQLFTDATGTLEDATINWIPGKPVTHITLWERTVENELINERIIDLSNEEKAAGRLVINNLVSGTGYQAQLFDDDIVRGTITFRTLGIQNGENVYVTPEDTITYLLRDCALRQVTDVSLVFEAGKVYDSGKITIPVGIENVVFVGKNVQEGTMPQLIIPSISLSEKMNRIEFEQVAVDGNNNATNYLFSVGNTNCFNAILFNNCEVKHFNRSVVRINAKDLNVESIQFKNCFLHDIGKSGYGLVNLAAQKEVGLIAITQCTMFELGDQVMQTNEGVAEIIIDQSTFYNNTMGIGKIFRFDKQPGTVAVTNTIFAGPNGGTKVNSGNGDYSTYLSFQSSYITTDFVVNTRPFTNITEYSGTSNDLFVDPENGDFHIKNGAKFEGKGVAGDPRWW